MRVRLGKRPTAAFRGKDRENDGNGQMTKTINHIPWTHDHLEKLREVASAGLKVAEILQLPEFEGRTKNMIIGKCRRLKIDISRGRHVISQPELEITSMIEIPKVVFPAKAQNSVVEVSLLTVGARQCRFVMPLMAEDGTAMVCGLKTVREGSSWCEEHSRHVVAPSR